MLEAEALVGELGAVDGLAPDPGAVGEVTALRSIAVQFSSAHSDPGPPPHPWEGGRAHLGIWVEPGDGSLPENLMTAEQEFMPAFKRTFPDHNRGSGLVQSNADVGG